MRDGELGSEYRGIGPPLRPEAEGRRLDDFLAKNFPFHSRREWKETCQRGHLLLNGKPVRGSHKLKGGDRLAVFHPLSAEPEVDEGITLLREEAGVLAVFKPGNLPMHEAGLFRRKTFGALLAEHFGKEWAPVHRLDRETSGVVLCAATPDLRRNLSQGFETRAVDKRYRAVVHGSPVWQELLVDQPLIWEENDRIPRLLVGDGGSPSQTEFTLLESGATAALLDIRPRTGRPNQIRVHAAWMGHPLVGDKIYHSDARVYDAYYEQGDSENVRVLAGHSRHALHAMSISVQHPGTNREFFAEAPWPDDLAELWCAAKRS